MKRILIEIQEGGEADRWEILMYSNGQFPEISVIENGFIIAAYHCRRAKLGQETVVTAVEKMCNTIKSTVKSAIIAEELKGEE